MRVLEGMSNSEFTVSENNDGDTYFTNEEGVTYWNKPTTDPLPEGWVEEISEDHQRYYAHPKYGSFWNRPKKNGTPRRLHISPVESTRPESTKPTAAVNERVAKYNKMRKMGIPEGSIRQKMMMNGLDPSLLFGGPPTLARPKLNLSVLPSLKKGNKTSTKKNNTPGPKANLSKSIAEAAVAQLGKLRKVNRTTNKNKKKPNNTPSGFAKFKEELATRAAKVAEKKANTSNTNYNGNNSWNNNFE